MNDRSRESGEISYSRFIKTELGLDITQAPNEEGHHGENQRNG